MRNIILFLKMSKKIEPNLALLKGFVEVWYEYFLVEIGQCKKRGGKLRVTCEWNRYIKNVDAVKALQCILCRYPLHFVSFLQRFKIDYKCRKAHIFFLNSKYLTPCIY